MGNTQELVELLRILGDPTRLRLLLTLGRGELTVSEITCVTGLSQPRVSRHLKLLCDVHVLQRTRDQNEVYYRANVDEDRNRLVQEVLNCLPDDDLEIAQDCHRLIEILNNRQTRACELLDELGVTPLDTTAINEVGEIVEKLLQGRMPDETPFGDLLDIGTGTGSMLRLLARKVTRAIAVDRSREMRLVARAQVTLEGLTNCTVRDGDMYNLSFPKESFDIVTMDRVLGTADRPHDALEQAASVLQKDGYLLVVETKGSPMNKENLGSRLTKARLTPIEVIQNSNEGLLIALAIRSTVSSQ
ncbi:MAG: ArsR/SmtB family transcription factor [Candidatus Rariloculaceae bacterium]